jgi:hypothetical protein
LRVLLPVISDNFRKVMAVVVVGGLQNYSRKLMVSLSLSVSLSEEGKHNPASPNLTLIKVV